MKIMVTGGAGFIGSHIVDRYIDIGHEVVIIDNLSMGQKRYINPKAKFYPVDIRDRKNLVSIFELEKPQILNHHAAQMDVRKSVADPIFDAENNILGIINLLEEGKKHGLQKVIFASSGGAIYGDSEILPTPETAPTIPASPYGISKLSSEYYLHFYAQTYKIPFISLRYGNVYGPRQNPHGEAGVIAIFIKKLLTDHKPVINGNGKQSRDFVFVEDVVNANILALGTSHNLIVNIGTGENTTINEVFQLLKSLSKTSLDALYRDPKPGEQQISLLDTSLAKSTLRWQPKIELPVGLQKTIEFFQHET